MRYVNGTRLDDRIIRTDWDAGFVEGRQYGRGKSGGQVRITSNKDIWTPFFNAPILKLGLNICCKAVVFKRVSCRGGPLFVVSPVPCA